MFTAMLSLLSGFVLLLGGAEFLVRGAVALAEKLHIPSLVIGLTIVALGTSLPELLVSVKAALQNNAGISVGNVIGSNIANILLVLGLSAVIYPIKGEKKAFYRDFTFLSVVTLTFTAFCLQKTLYCYHGIILLVMLALFMCLSYVEAKENPTPKENSALSQKGWFYVGLITIAGLVAITYGAEFLVKGAVTVAKIFGISEAVIGATVIAVGTSMPELATSCVAAYRRQNDIALGNVIGSNIWNILCIIGVSSAITDISVAPQFLRFDIWMMLLAVVLLFPVMLHNHRISRREGTMLVGFYVLYIYGQYLIASGLWNV